jgi:hypothetical protein
MPSWVTGSLWSIYVNGVLTTCPDFLSTELGIYAVVGAVFGLIARFLIKEL